MGLGGLSPPPQIFTIQRIVTREFKNSHIQKIMFKHIVIDLVIDSDVIGFNKQVLRCYMLVFTG